MKAWYFSEESRLLRFGDKRLIAPGETHKVDGPLRMCEYGLHASANIMDALNFAPGPILWRVEIGGQIETGTDKLCATERTYLWGVDASECLRAFARKCALDVIHLWDAPEVVVRYLKTGDDSLRDAARDAARAAARAAARDAAWAAAWEKQSRRILAMVRKLPRISA